MISHEQIAVNTAMNAMELITDKLYLIPYLHSYGMREVLELFLNDFAPMVKDISDKELAQKIKLLLQYFENNKGILLQINPKEIYKNKEWLEIENTSKLIFQDLKIYFQKISNNGNVKSKALSILKDL